MSNSLAWVHQEASPILRGKGEIGQAPYNPTIALKMLLLFHLYNISGRQVEVLANDSLFVACFLGLGADEKAPDHSTLTLFKNRLLENGGKKAYEDLFDEIIRIARVQGVKFGKLLARFESSTGCRHSSPGG